MLFILALVLLGSVGLDAQTSPVQVDQYGSKFSYTISAEGCLINGVRLIAPGEEFVHDFLGPCVWWRCDASEVTFVQIYSGMCTLPGGDTCYKHSSIHEVGGKYCRCLSDTVHVCE